LLASSRLFPYTTLFRSGLGHHDDGGGAVGDLGGRARGDRPVLAEGGAQLGEGLGGRVAAHALVGGEDDRLAAPLGDLDRGDLVRSEEHTSELQSRENLV